MEVILPQRLVVRKRKSEDTLGHASSSQPLSTLPGMHWESKGGVPVPRRKLKVFSVGVHTAVLTLPLDTSARAPLLVPCCLLLT